MQVRKATVADVIPMQQLIQKFASQGLMLPRTEKALYEHLQCFKVAVIDDIVVGCAGLHILWGNLAEVRSLAVDERCHGLGVGRALVEAVIQDAYQLQIEKVLSLTYQTIFFEKLGFYVVDKETLPHKVWKDCVFCSKFASCDEIAMVYYTGATIQSVI